MDLLLGLVALIVAVAALALVLIGRGRVATLETELKAARKHNADLHAAHGAMHHDLAEVRAELQTAQRDLDRTQRALGELKAAAEVVPVPPLPRRRSGRLDDLREQLRAAHREPDPTEDE
jgi:septal ring factor EnvC (AmiA/AmiB activator)